MIPKPCVIDVVDLSDDGGIYWRDCLDGHNTFTIAIGGMSNAIQKMVDLVLAKTGGKPVLRCLALWGHGAVDRDENPLGIHLLAGGWDAQFNQSAFTPGTISALHHSLIRLRPCFANGGRVELRGCGAAGSSQGIDVMKTLAKQWGVAIQGAKKNQPTMSWLPPVVEVTPGGDVREVKGTEYNLRL
jgi:hypothetical protein